MKRFLIKVFIFPWKLAHHSEFVSILIFVFIFLITFTTSTFILYLTFGLIFPKEIFIPLTVISSFIITIAFMIIYPMIADSLYDKEATK